VAETLLDTVRLARHLKVFDRHAAEPKTLHPLDTKYFLEDKFYFPKI